MADHIYHFNVHGEQRFFLGSEHRTLYDFIALNGNIVSHTPTGVAAFVANAGKTFYIDPQTHAFQHATIHLKRDIGDLEKGKPSQFEFKPSIEKLAKKRLGEPFSKVIDNDKPLLPSEFISSDGKIRNDVITKVCESVVDFQRRTMIDSLDDEAKEFMGDGNSFQPKFIIAPYFYLSSSLFSEWFEIMTACYSKTKQVVRDLPVYMALVISKDVLDDDAEKIISGLVGMKLDGILLWIDEHIEEDLSINEIYRYVKLLKGLRNSAETIYNSHGGYLSILLCHAKVERLLNGVGHSINYGESRAVIPIGGGLPMARFYYPHLHSRVRFGDALSIMLSNGSLVSSDQYRANVCMCVQCSELIKSKSSINEAFSAYGESYPITIRNRSGSIRRLEYPTKEAKQAAARHYLYNKKNEFDEFKNKTYDELLDNLVKSYQQILPHSGGELVGHLLRWNTSLRELTK